MTTPHPNAAAQPGARSRRSFIATLASLGIATLAIGAAASLASGQAEPATTPADDAKPSLFLIGDSTMRNGHGDGVGWGERLSQFFDTDRITIHNRAIAGRSSRTFRTEGRWDSVLEAAQPGDFVLIQFGHNDGIAPDDPERPRGSLRGTGDETFEMVHPQSGEPETVRTYGWYMRKYVKEARENGLIPIICSYVPRAPRRGETADPELESYGLWAKEVAEQEGAAFIDLFGRISSEYAELEEKAPHSVKERFFVGGDRDYTHTTAPGAEMNARILVEGIRELEGEAGELASYLKDAEQ